MGKLKIKDFKSWFEKINQKAIKERKSKAEKKYGNKDKWEKIVWKSADKNKAIKEIFRDKLKYLDSNPKYENGWKYEIRPNDKTKRKYHTGEWLYDFCLRKLKISDDTKTEKLEKVITLKKIILAMEVEMTQNEGSIRNDFHKLLQSDAQYKIMVFQQRNKKRGKDKGLDLVEEMFKKLKYAADAYNSKSNSKYLLCGWSIIEQKFKFYKFNTPKAK